MLVLSLIRNRLVLFALVCLVFGQSVTFSAVTNDKNTAQISLTGALSPSIAISSADLEYNIDLALRVMITKKVYLYINEKLGKAAVSQGILPNPKILISQTKLIYMLTQLPSDHVIFEKVLNDIRRQASEGSISTDEKTTLQELNPVLDKIIKDTEVMKKLISSQAHEQPLVLYDVEMAESTKKIKRVGYEDMVFYANHPRYENPDDPSSRIIPADDHKKIMVDMVNEAKSGDKLYFNFYDFDLTELSEALVLAKQRGVEILGGVDAKVYQAKPSVKALIDDLAQKEVVVEKVDSTGLNHQKILVLKSQYGRSKTLFSSGNATQSCSGPEGDLKEVPPALRPANAIPNPNNMVMIMGEIPATIALSEIRKNIVYKLRGQSEFPIGGAFQLMGKWDAQANIRESILMAFSPNGGLGHVGRDIFSKIFRAGNQSVEGAFFSFSSKDNLDQLFESIFRIVENRRAQNLPATDIIKFVGDSQFALREFSNLLTLSGYKLLEYDPREPYKVPAAVVQNVDPENPLIKPTVNENKKVYIKDTSDKRLKKLRSLLTKDEWQNWLDNIRVSPNWFMGDKVNYQGKDYMWQVKLHDKVVILPDQFVSNPGTSINFSLAGESNQEQILIVVSRRITQQLRGAVKYLFDKVSSVENSVFREVQRRNKRFSQRDIDTAYLVDKFRARLEQSNQCLRRYSKSGGISVLKP